MSGTPEKPTGLKRILTPTMVWGLGVGYVISGNYFGWNLGLEAGGSYGLAIATLLAIMLYVTFTYSYAELSCAIPKAGGAFDYAHRALGPKAGFIAGMAQNIEFIFAPPAISLAIGTYLNLFMPGVPMLAFSVAAYIIFTGLNVYGVKLAAMVELTVTVMAVGGLMLFAANVLPHVSLENLGHNAWPAGYSGIFAAIPFAIWFFLGIEGIANLAEESVDPRRTMSKGFIAALFTLIILCVFTFTGSVGVAGWEAVVFQSNGSTSDAPLPMAMEAIRGKDDGTYTLLVILGLSGLVASFHGLMLAAGRSTLEFARINFPKSAVAATHPTFQTPAWGLVLNAAIGCAALFTGRTGDIITLSVLGALSLYAISMVAMIALRRREPGLARPFRAPFFPVFPATALLLTGVALTSVAVYNPKVTGVFVLIMAGCFGIFSFRKMSAS
jgi:ethanolamine permease